MTVTILAPGVPQPKGSTRSFVDTAAGRRGRARTITVSDNPKLKAWQATVGFAARVAVSRWAAPQWRAAVQGPVHIDAEFIMPRPKAIARALNPAPPMTRPDVDKLLRGVLDALTGVLWVDDAQVVSVVGVKRYADIGEGPGAHLIVETL